MRNSQAAAESTGTAALAPLPSPSQPGSQILVPQKPHALPEIFYLFSFMLHCSFNRDRNMQGDATRQQELAQSTVGRGSWERQETLPATTASPKPPTPSPTHSHRLCSLSLLPDSRLTSPSVLGAPGCSSCPTCGTNRSSSKEKQGLSPLQ